MAQACLSDGDFPFRGYACWIASRNRLWEREPTRKGRWFGLASSAVDSYAKAVERAKRIPGVHAWVGDLFEQSFPKGSFDAIVMNNVIEHLPQPKETLENALPCFEPGGG
ncbi:class I SAM-dependent methyltransferase [Sphingomonas mesophila]|uniref:class I SAM-dependent methyltransferase n=1 Tax=Sphingomonas mesophila TaxID=2303576 RepID=UPI003B83149F